MKKVIICEVFLGIVTGALANTMLTVYESDGVTEFDGHRIRVGTRLQLIVTADANDFWSGGLFISGNNRELAFLSGRGKDPNSRDYSGSRWPDAGTEALVTHWEDSIIEGFDLFSDVNCVPGDWFVVDYTALSPGDPNVGFYEHSVSWNDPNEFVTLHQVPTADFNTDGIVNFLDYSLLASCWQEDDCTDPDGCQKADIYTDGVVDINDLMLFSDYWLWGAPEPNEPNEAGSVDPVPDPNLIYSIVDANGLSEITVDVGETVTLYVDMDTIDVNEVWAFTVEVDLSDPNLGSIDNTAYDPNNPPGEGTACILASPNRWTAFDRWGPGYEQPEGIYLMGLSSEGAFQDGHLASFKFTCQGSGDIELYLLNHDTTSTSGENLYPTVNGMLIHQNDPNEQMMMGSGMSSSSMMLSQGPSLSPEEMVQFLEEIWLVDDGIQDVITEEDWLKFIESVKESYEQNSIVNDDLL